MVRTFVLDGGGLRSAGQAPNLAAASRALPDGVYTTLRTYHGHRFVRLDQHLARLEESAALEGMTTGLDRAGVRALVAHALAECGPHLARLRLTLAPPRLYLSLEPLVLLPAALYETGARCVTVAARRSNPHAKDTRFLETAQGVSAVLPPGIHEGLMVADDGALLEGLTSNFFALHRGVLHTEATRVLLGVTRGLILDAARGLVALEETPVRRVEVPELAECFLTSASRGVLPVVEIDAQPIGTGRPGPITRALTERFTALVEQEARPL